MVQRSQNPSTSRQCVELVDPYDVCGQRAGRLPDDDGRTLVINHRAALKLGLIFTLTVGAWILLLLGIYAVRLLLA